jgi:hypothetical protein
MLTRGAKGRRSVADRSDHVDVRPHAEQEEERVAIDLGVLDEEDADRFGRRRH